MQESKIQFKPQTLECIEYSQSQLIKACGWIWGLEEKICAKNRALTKLAEVTNSGLCLSWVRIRGYWGKEIQLHNASRVRSWRQEGAFCQTGIKSVLITPVNMIMKEGFEYCFHFHYGKLLNYTRTHIRPTLPKKKAQKPKPKPS